jgi:hypothetical protein
MQKLEKLSAFQGSQLSKDAMRKIYGGDTETGAGTICVATSLSSTGCCSVSSDRYDDKGRLASFSCANGTVQNSDVNQPC